MSAVALTDRLLRCAFDADARVLDWLEAGGVEDRALLGWQSHILAAQNRWGCRIAELPDDADIFAVLDLPRQRELQRLAPPRLLAALEGDLDRSLHFVRNGITFTMTVGEALLQVATHGHHHHGQMATHARRVGLEGFPDTSFLGYVRAGG